MKSLENSPQSIPGNLLRLDPSSRRASSEDVENARSDGSRCRLVLLGDRVGVEGCQSAGSGLIKGQLRGSEA